MPSFVHSSAEVEPGAVVGVGTAVWHHSQVRAGSVVGESCVLGKNVFVDAGVVIGDRVQIQNNVSVYRGVELADDVFVGPSAVFTNDLRPRAGVRDWQILATTVRPGASIGANATIICGVQIGEYGMVGAGAVVTGSVLPHQLVVGNPARHGGWVCSCGRVVSRAAQPPADFTCARCRPQRRPAGSDLAGQHRIRLGGPQFGAEEEAAVIEVLRSGQLVSGARVADFERAFAAEHGAAHAVAVSNGTIALVAALRAHRIGAGDEVITSPLTFVATLNAILEVGATVRLADVADDFTMDPASLAARITPLTKAVIPVHLYGLPADLTAIGEIAADRDLAVIADAAQAHGARLDGRPVGASGTATFSFYATKNITCGEGGMVTANDDDVAERLRLLRNHGSRDGYDYLMPGYNYRMTELQAAIATVQLRRLAVLNACRADHAARLAAGLADLPGLVRPASPPGRLHVWHQYTVRLTAQAGLSRDDLAKELDLAGIDSRAYYPRLAHDYPCYRGHRRIAPDHTPRAAELVQQVLSLPVHPGLSEADVDRVIRAVRQAVSGQEHVAGARYRQNYL